MSELIERWRPVVRWEGLYEVSDLGRVRSLGWHTRRGYRPGRVLRAHPDGSGHLTVDLYRGDGRRAKRKVHQLVLEAFGPPATVGQQSRHGPAGKSDNSIANLSYGSHIENCEDRARDGVYHHKLTRADAAEIRRRLKDGELRRVVAADYGVHIGTVSKIKYGTRWREPEPEPVTT